MIIPAGYRPFTLRLTGGAVRQRFFQRSASDPTFRLLGMQVDYAGAVADFNIGVRTEAEVTLDFMRFTGIGALGIPTMHWPVGLVAGAPPTLSLLVDHIDIPPNGSLTVLPSAAATAVDLDIILYGYELTKNIISRTLLGTNPESVAVGPDGRFAPAYDTPSFELQGGVKARK